MQLAQPSKRYEVFGLTFASETALPELATPQHSRKADVTLRLGAVSPDGLSGGRQLGPFLWAGSDAIWLRVPRIARFLVRTGTTVLIDPEPNSDEDSIRAFLLDSVLGALMFQRGLLILRGAAIAVDGRSMLLLGYSGAGKSSLAARLMQRGYAVLSDGLVAVDAAGRALPGPPRIQLWHDAAKNLGIETTGLKRIRAQIEQFNLPVCGADANKPIAIHWAYLPTDARHQDDIRIEPVDGVQRFMPLYQNTYRCRFAKGLDLRSENLALCGVLAARIRVARLMRPAHGAPLDTMIDRIITDITERG